MNENIKVFLRIKPNVDNTSHLSDEDCASYKINNNNKLFLFEKKKKYNEINKMKTKTFFFNHIFDTHVQQNEIFELVGKTLVDNFINGYNSSILAYGNTNSGKTYTLYGERKNPIKKENKGLIYFCLSYFFDLYKTHKDIELFVSVIEIYLEKIRDLGKIFELYHQKNNNDDLLNFYSNFRESIIREDRKGNTYVENMTLLPVKKIEDVIDIIDLCFKYRRTTATKKNLVSSRSHCLLSVYQYKYSKERQLISQINFIDLAGAEKFTDIEMVNKNELININNTLSVLNRVIIALSTKNKISRNFDEKNKSEENQMHLAKIHIPYRDSKLTRLLKNSLDGNSFTYILICLNLHSYRIDDFINSLIFAKRCKTIKKIVRKNNIKDDDNTTNDEYSNSDTTNISYESCDSISSDFQFLINKNIINKYNLDDDSVYIKKMKTKNNTKKKNILLNKLTRMFSSIMNEKCQRLTKQKNSIIYNIIKIVKNEENNKEQLQKNKKHCLLILKERKKELYKNEKLLNKILNTTYEENAAAKTEIKEEITTESIKKTNKKDINENKQTEEQHIQKNMNDTVQQTNPIKEKTNNFDDLEKTNQEMKKIYADIEKLLQIEIQKLNQKIHIIEELTFLNKCLFININKLTKILSNIYQNKYNVIIKSGTKQLNIPNYIYENITKLYEKKLLNSVKDSHMLELSYLKDTNEKILTIYETINQRDVLYEFKKS